MATTSTMMLDRPRWRAINILYGLTTRALAAQTSNPATVAALTGMDIERETLVLLERRGYVRAHYAGTKVSANIATSPADITVVELTAGGITWWHHNPPQRALLAARHRQRAPLGDLVRTRAVDPQAVAQIVEAGLAYVWDDGARREVANVTVERLRTRYVATRWHLFDSPAGRALLAVEED